VPASEIALKHLGRPLPNTALLGGFARCPGWSRWTRWRTPSATSSRRGGRGNVAAATEAYDYVRARSRSWPMLKQIEGSRAVAEAVALCRPEVICAYPISPQTHIVEGLGELVKAARWRPASSSTSRASSRR
jgi:hypothetical protein